MATLVQRHLATDVGKPTLGFCVLAQQHKKTRAVRKDSAAIHVRKRSSNGNQPGECGPYMQAEANKKSRMSKVLYGFQRACQRYAGQWSAQHQKQQAASQCSVILIARARLQHSGPHGDCVSTVGSGAARAPAQMKRANPDLL